MSYPTWRIAYFTHVSKTTMSQGFVDLKLVRDGRVICQATQIDDDDVAKIGKFLSANIVGSNASVAVIAWSRYSRDTDDVQVIELNAEIEVPDETK